MEFASIDNRSILTVSARSGFHQIDLNSSQLIKTFSVAENTTFPTTAYEYTLYSKDFQYFYGLTQNITDTRFSIKIWANNNDTKNPIHEINLPEQVFLGPMTNLKESDSALAWTLEPFGPITKVYTFDKTGALTIKGFLFLLT
jgi:hypothetical protein